MIALWLHLRMSSLKWKVAQIAEFGWWKKYLHGKDVETYLSWKKKYWKDFLQKCKIDIPKEKSILDAGCGPAGMFMILDENQVIALDPLLDKYEDIAHFSSKNYSFASFINGRLEDFNFGKKFDLIFCLNAINHVASLDSSMDALMLHLAEDGQLVLSVDVHQYALVKRIFRLFPGDILHPQQHTTQNYLDKFTALGLGISHYFEMDAKWPFKYTCWVLKKAG